MGVLPVPIEGRTGRGVGLIGGAMRGLLRIPGLVFAFGVDQLRRLPGARLVSPLVPWIARALFLGALVLVLLWMAEASPQRISLADLAAGKLSTMQSWIIVSGDLADEPGSTASLRQYRLTDPAAPNAYLVVQTTSTLPLGPTTVSGRLEGGRDGVPAGYQWTARLHADPQLANELPPPMTALVLALGGVLLIAARRSRYPRFVSERPGEAHPALGALQVVVRADGDTLGGRALAGSMVIGASRDGAADVRIQGRERIPVRLHSAFTNVDVGRLRSLTSSAPALRVQAPFDDLTLGFASARDRDGAFAALSVEAQRLRPAG